MIKHNWRLKQTYSFSFLINGICISRTIYYSGANPIRIDARIKAIKERIYVQSRPFNIIKT